MELILYSTALIPVSVLLYWFLIPNNWQSRFLFALSVCFMSLFSATYTVYFVFNAALVYIAGTFIGKSDKNGKLFLKLMLVWLIGSLCVFKYTHLAVNSMFKVGSYFSLVSETTFTKIAIPLGLSYIMFRLIHYIVEIYRKTLPEHSFWDMALYVFFFPTFIAGPVDRFQRIQPQIAEKKPFDLSDINNGLFRIVSGMLKKFVVADTLTRIVMPVLSSPGDYSRLLVLLSVYGMAIRLYMDFSGYTDMALGVARLFGYKIMENFNYPFFQKNIAMFWRNWHISVYSFIRDYFFFPLFGYRASQVKIYIGIFITMFVFMMWHDANMSFLILALYHGGGLVAWHLFQELKGKYPKLRRAVDKKYLDPVSVLLTFTFVGFSFAFFGFSANEISSIMHRLFT